MDRRSPRTPRTHRASARTAVAVVLAAALVALAGCGSSEPSPTRAVPGASAPPSPGSSGAPTSGPDVTKLLVFVVENHALEQMQQEMPWLNGLAQQYGYATDYRALAHPSLPNYLAMAGGDMFGVTDDDPPSEHPVAAPSVFGRALDAGRTATVYAEAMTTPCQQADDGTYAVRHNPWAYFRSEQEQCREHDVPLSELQQDVAGGDLPNVGMVVPDTCSDAHDCPLSEADDWMRQYVGTVLDGPDFASGHLAVVVTADEDDEHHDNRVLTVVAHPTLEHEVVSTGLTHYSLSRAYAEAAGIEPLGNAADAPSLLSAFGLGR
ncbi:MAG TPA: alkaline phosphatase family protein [Nocardioides sp.]|nr:alkaline phosphatase family protein [Nocardioides sp.]